MLLSAASSSDPGLVRATNQDQALVAGNLLAVADGMGGHAGGEVAARIAVAALQRSFSTDPSASGLVNAAIEANQEVFHRAEREPALRGMGTTLTAAALVEGNAGDAQVVVVNVGDSRAYLLREGGALVRLTQDHSLVEELLRRGEITTAQAAVHPHRHILTRALGIDPDVDVDAFELELEATSRLLLCSDGLTNECSDDEIAAVLASEPTPQAAADTLVRLALEHGGSDNVTVVVADLDAELEASGKIGSDASRSSGPAIVGRPRKAGAGRALGVPMSRTERASGGAPSPSASALHGVSRATRRREPLGRVVAAAASAAEPGSDRVLTFRVALFLLVLVAVLGGTAGAVGWYVRASWYVGVDAGKVAIFEGRPGGFLWFRPALYERSNLSVHDVFTPELSALEAGMLQPSLAAARRVVSDLSNSSSYLTLPSGNSGPAAEVFPSSAGLPTSPVPTSPVPTASVTTTTKPASPAPTTPAASPAPTTPAASPVTRTSR